jgi:hypothetical protein
MMKVNFPKKFGRCSAAIDIENPRIFRPLTRFEPENTRKARIFAAASHCAGIVYRLCTRKHPRAAAKNARRAAAPRDG